MRGGATAGFSKYPHHKRETITTQNFECFTKQRLEKMTWATYWIKSRGITSSSTDNHLGLIPSLPVLKRHQLLCTEPKHTKAPTERKVHVHIGQAEKIGPSLNGRTSFTFLGITVSTTSWAILTTCPGVTFRLAVECECPHRVGVPRPPFNFKVRYAYFFGLQVLPRNEQHFA